MAAPRRVIALVSDAAQRQQLQEIARSRTEPASRVERARIILGYLAEPSAYAVARAVGVTAQTVSRCLDRAAELGVIEALDDRQHTSRDPTITAEARTWLVALACQKPKALGYSHELWTTRLLAAHARDRGPAAGHPSVAKLAQGTVCKILADHAVKPHKSRPSRRRGCAITGEARSRNSSPGWRKSCASIAKSRCCASRNRARRATRRARSEARPSSPMTRSPVFRRSARPRRIVRRCLAPARP